MHDISCIPSEYSIWKVNQNPVYAQNVHYENLAAKLSENGVTTKRDII